MHSSHVDVEILKRWETSSFTLLAKMFMFTMLSGLLGPFARNRV
jgi:hypothetical protein